MEKQLWVDRQFVFDTPVGLFPSLLERLRGTPARVEERVRDLSAEVLRRREGESWSIQENVGHLLATETLWSGRLDDYRAGCQILRPADLKNRRTEDANYNQRSIEEILTSFRDSRMRLVQRLEELDEAGVETSAMHPRLNRPMRVIDMVLFAAEHDDHHLARITELAHAFRSGR